MDRKRTKVIFFLSYFSLLFILWFLLNVDNYSYGLVVVQNESIKINDETLTSEIVYRGFEFPTSMAFLDKDNILVLEKNNGTVKKITNGKVSDTFLIDLNVSTKGERGLLGIATTDSNEKNNNNRKNNQTYVYLYLTESSEKDGDDHDNKTPLGNRIYRFELSEDRTKLVNKTLLINLPAEPKAIHNGGKIIIGPDNNLYFTIGDLDDRSSQIANNKTGSKIDGRAGILRITQDGDPVKDDFSLGEIHPMDKYFAYGIRNSFGLDFDPVTGKLWDTENGPHFGDEINLVEPGFNSGWRKIMGSGNSSNSTENSAVNLNDLVLFNGKGKYSAPEFAWNQSIGVTGIKFFDSIKLGKDYENTIFVGDFRSGKLLNFKLNENRTLLESGGTKLKTKVNESELESSPFIFAEGFGGIVDIQTGPDGYLYILSLQYGGEQCRSIKFECINYSSNYPGTIFRITPK